MSTYNNKYDILGSTIKPNPASVKYWADLASNPNGGDLKYFNGKDWVYVNSKATGDITELQEDVKQLQTDIKNKVDKVSGKGLSTNDYTTAEKNKLAGIAANANNYTLPTASDSTINDDSIIRDVLLNNWDVNQQLKMVNDYFAYKLGLNKDEICKTRYENFLEFRSKLKTSVTKSII